GGGQGPTGIVACTTRTTGVVPSGPDEQVWVGPVGGAGGGEPVCVEFCDAASPPGAICGGGGCGDIGQGVGDVLDQQRAGTDLDKHHRPVFQGCGGGVQGLGEVHRLACLLGPVGGAPQLDGVWSLL